MAIDGSTYNLPVPRRPGLDDVEYLPKSNAAGLPPPDPRTGLAAEEFQAVAEDLVAIAKVSPVCVISIDQTGTSYTLLEFSAAGDNVATESFTIARQTAGWVRITWPSDTFPTRAAEPMGAINGTHPAMISVVSISNGVDVHIDTGSGSGDRPFTVQIY